MRDTRFDRLAHTSTFRNGGAVRWQKAQLAVVGAGTVGSQFVLLAAQSGVGRITVCDPDVTQPANLGTQPGQVGKPKVQSLAIAANQMQPGCTVGRCVDILHVGPGELTGVDLLIDTTDDPGLELYLTPLVNGIGIPKLRLAVDGTGRREMGRVTCSHGASGYACGLCSYSVADVARELPRAACAERDTQRNPTYAGGPLAAAISGIGLLQAQRLITGNDVQLVLNRTLVLDLSRPQLLAITLRRAEDCLSGHLLWDLREVPGTGNETTLGAFMEAGRRLLGRTPETVEPFAHGLYTRAFCNCGQQVDAVGSRWARPPCCIHCGRVMQWMVHTLRTRLCGDDIDRLAIADTPIEQLGLPASGAMIVARVPDQPPLRMVLSSAPRANQKEESCPSHAR